MPMSGLSIHLLGPPRIRFGGIDLDIRRRKVIALIVYLVVTAKPHNRDTLAEMLYPEHSRGSAFSGLRMLLSTARTLVGGERIQATRESVEFRVLDGDDVDVTRFLQLLRSIDDATADRGGDFARLQEAQNLYAGRFLEGFYLDECRRFEEWQEQQAAELEEHYKQCLDRVSERLAEAGDVTGAIDLVSRRLLVDPCDEDTVRRLMRLHLQAGQPRKAIEQYHTCRELLDQRYGMTPDEETERLLLSVREVSASPRSRRRRVLPVVRTTFYGRQTELEWIRQNAVNSSTSLTTIVGPPGVGKTRLAIEAARAVEDQLEHGVVFVDLSSTTDPSQFWNILSDTLRVHSFAGERRDLGEVVRATIDDRDLLLILDNVEHLLPRVAGDVASLIECAGPTFVATSREPLRVQGEQVLELAPLDSLSEECSPENDDAIRLFIDRATGAGVEPTRLESERPVIARICSELDRLPLAIELVASHAPLFGPSDLLNNLGSPLPLLEEGLRDAPERHQSMRRAIRASYDALSDDEQALFCRLSVFAAGFDLEAAAAVDPGGAPRNQLLRRFSTLAQRHLIASTNEASRFTMLHVIREYARERLRERGDETEAQHAFVKLIRSATREPREFLNGPDESVLMSRLDTEIANWRAALDYCDRNRLDEDGLWIAAALGGYWVRRGPYGEGVHWLELFADRTRETGDPKILGWVYYCAAWLRRFFSDVPAATDYEDVNATRALRRSLECATRAGDLVGKAHATMLLGLFQASLPIEERCALAERGVALARKSGRPFALAFCLATSNQMPWPEKTLQDRKRELTEAAVLAEQIGNPMLRSEITGMFGRLLGLQHDDVGAEKWHREALQLAQDAGLVRIVVVNSLELCDGYCRRGMLAQAKGSMATALSWADAQSSPNEFGDVLRHCGSILTQEERHYDALRLQAAASLFVADDLQQLPDDLCDDPKARAAWEEGRTMTARRAVDFALKCLE
jgi:predicted ATPase/DNA-binding SARP family transcriptional activator